MTIDFAGAHRRATMLPRLECFVLLALLAACGPSISYTPSSRTYPARPANCPLVVVAAPPDPEEYRQIGIIDADNNVTPYPIRNAGAFRDAVAATACEAGGHLIVAEANGRGDYIRGALYRLVERD